MESPVSDFSSQLKRRTFRLRDCIHKHQDVCGRQRRTLRPTSAGPAAIGQELQEPQDLRVIDVRNLKVIQGPPNCRYVALSYVWERGNAKGPRHSSSFPSGPTITRLPSQLNRSELPQTVADAIEVCVAIEETYLWVDAVCIMQNDPVDVAKQVAQMDKIYSYAVATLIVAAEMDPSQGIPGLRTPFLSSRLPLQEALDKTLWSSRGWTYQELILSRRLLFFTSQGIYFHCAEGARSALPSWELPGYSPHTCWNIFNRSLELYTTRHLGRKFDTLNAISSVQRVLARITDDAFFCGLPMRQLFYAMLWQPLAVAERQSSWPSWSWAGWTGSGEQLCPVTNPVQGAVEVQWSHDSPARLVDKGRVFHSRLSNLTFCSADSEDKLAINLYPDDKSLEPYLVNQKIEKLPALGTDRIFHNKGFLKFKTSTISLSIVPEEENPRVSEDAPLLKRCRIMQGDTWIGTIFLNPDSKGNYPDISGPCEFIVLTKFTAYKEGVSSYLRGMLPASGEEAPAIFPASHYEEAEQEHMRQFKAWAAGQYHSRFGYRDRDPLDGSFGRSGNEADPHMGMPYPAQVECLHVMWIDREGDIIYRKAIGIIGGDGPSYPSEEFCLG